MGRGLTRLCVLGSALVASLVRPALAADEASFIEELPVVLSGSRLAQPLRDVPGAMTVIDRATIRRMGARDLADVLRWVPGFQVAQSTNGGNAPLAVYHGLTTDHPQSMQVLVDGRSQYSPLWFGGVNFNTLQVALEDVERIEVLRGSNSAAFGSNALLGVVNIVTVDPAQVRGAAVAANSGNQGVRDYHARLAGGERVAQRLSVSRQFDRGLAYFADDRETKRAEWRGDIALSPRDDLRLTLGSVDARLGVGLPAGSNNDDDPERRRSFSSQYLQGEWTRRADNGDELRLRYFHVRESGRDQHVVVEPPARVPFDYEPRMQRDDFELQGITAVSAALRTVWGAGWRRDTLRSQQFFATDEALKTVTRRLFGHAEWRLAPQWLLNAGATWEDETLAGRSWSPRLMLNFQPDRRHTLRAGAYRAQRTPSFYEQRANVVAIDPLLSPPPGPPLAVAVRASGELRHERLHGRELSYFGDFRDSGASLDLRAFDERISGRINRFERDLPAGACLLCGPGGFTASDFANAEDLRIRGFEFQWRWRTPWASEIWLNHASIRIVPGAVYNVPNLDTAHISGSAPRRSESLHWMQELPWGANLTASYAWSPAYKWTRNTDNIGAHRLDWRLALPFRTAWGRGELSWTARADNGPLSEYRYGQPQRYKQQIVDPRHWLGLQIEF